MKHIFMGKVISKKYNLLYYPSYSSYQRIVNNLSELNYLAKKNISVFINENNEITEWKTISITDSITERLDLEKLVLINNEELTIEKIVQNENGDVICYLNKIVKIIKDENSYKEAIDLLNFYKTRVQDLKNEEVMQSSDKRNKWWQFWKSK